MGELLAVAIAANIVQLVDGASKAFNICHQIYSLGASIDDTRIINTSEELNQAYSVLMNSLNQNAAPSGHGNHRGDVQLRELANRCIVTAKHLIHELQKIKKPPGGDLRKALSIALRRRLKAKKLEQLKHNLDEYQKALDSKVLVEVRERLKNLRAEQHGDTSRLEQQLAAISANLDTCHISVSIHLKTEIDRSMAINEEQHAKTREHVGSETDRAISNNQDQHTATRQHAERHIVSAIRNLEMAQDLRCVEESHVRLAQREYEKFLESLWFSDMNLRRSEISTSHSGTFQWMFDDKMKRPWSSYLGWLTGNVCLYFVQGKPGSGKSTLIKFLAENQRTMELLRRWSPNNDILIVSFYFWLSGSKLQRGLKGLLCSIIHQIMAENRDLFKLIRGDKKLLAKRNINDWSVRELQHLLKQTIDMLPGNICMFIDGLDEFDQEDDMDNLFSMIENSSSFGKVKICVSSRPETYIMKRMSRYCQVRLQDLTRDDIRHYIHDKLHAARSNCSLAVVNECHVFDIVERMTSKAEGVFLWVYYALSSLIRGMRSADDFKELLRQIEELPRGMNELYTQMWNRLNENKQRYRDEATMYFSYEYFYPLSIFELLVATDRSLQTRYSTDCKPLDTAELTRRCERLAARIHTRTAGMLEIYEDPRFGKSYNVRDNTGTWTKAKSQIVDLPVANTGPLVTSFASNQDPCSEDTLVTHYHSKVKFMHRTARDFILDSTDGHNIFGTPVDSHENRVESLLRARIVLHLQGLVEFNAQNLHDSIERIGLPEVKHESELLTHLRRACEHLSLPNQPNHHIGYQDFWGGASDFQCAAIHYGCTRYISSFVLQENTYVSPYYLGFLLIYTAQYFFYVDRYLGLEPQQWSNISWLLLHGADIFTNHADGDSCIFNPASALLSMFFHPAVNNSSVTRQATECLRILIPMVYHSTAKCIIWLYPRIYTEITTQFSWDNLVENVPVRMTIAKLCRMTMQHLGEPVPFNLQQNRDSAFNPEHVTEVLFFPPLEGYSEGEHIHPSTEDSLYLGEALDNFLFWDETSPLSRDASLEAFNARLMEVQERSPRGDLEELRFKIGWKVHRDRLSERTLDPTEHVDESNWMERGHFKKPYELLDLPSSVSKIELEMGFENDVETYVENDAENDSEMDSENEELSRQYERLMAKKY